MVMAKKKTSVEEKVEDLYKEELRKLGIRYFTKTEPINPSIDEELKKGPSKSGKLGGVISLILKFSWKRKITDGFQY